MPLLHQARATVAVAVLVVLLAACASSPSASAPLPSSPSQASAAPTSPEPTPSPSADPSTEPLPTPNPTPPTPRSVAWADPVAVDALKGCFSIVPTVDGEGGIHVAAVCADGLRYATSRDGQRWTSDVFKVPAGRDDTQPMIAVSGDTVAFAWTRNALDEGGCGDDGLVDLGVYVRTRKLDQDAWSPARRIGAAGDELQAFRYVGSTIHAVVSSDESRKTWYERVDGSGTHRVELRGASGPAALRIANDGRPHLVYPASGAVRYAVIRGDVVDSETIPGTKDGLDPAFVLGIDDTAYVLFSRNNLLGGCAEPEPDPANGVYFSSNVGGEWSTTKISDRVGTATLTVEPGTSEVYAIVGDMDRIQFVHKPFGEDWITGSELPTKGVVSSVAIRQDPATGKLLTMFVQDASDADSDPAFQVILVREA
jgi:hypothetical protein